MKIFHVRMCDQRERETEDRKEKKGSLVAEAHQICANLMGWSVWLSREGESFFSGRGTRFRVLCNQSTAGRKALTQPLANQRVAIGLNRDNWV
jgi:hypothetical protein